MKSGAEQPRSFRVGILLKSCAAFLIASVICSTAIAQTASQNGMTTSTMKLPQYRKTKLPNGLTLLLMERHNLPLVTFQVLVKSGSTSDPAGEEGTASVTAALLRRGTKLRTADQFSQDLDFIGGAFGASAASEYTDVSAEFMKKDLDKGLDLLSEALLAPVFPEPEVTKLLRQRTDALKAAKDQAAGVIGAYYSAFLFGNSPYARPTTGDEQSIGRIHRDEVVKFYETYYKPGNTIFAVVGDFDSAQMEKEISGKFGSWLAGNVAPAAAKTIAPVSGRRFLLIDKPDSTQTYFRIGNLGIERTNPDRVYVQVVNTLFGGRFTSLINSALRINSGLTYGANSTFDQRKNGGAFFINSYTRNATTEQALDMSLEVLKQFRDKGITAEQLASAKAYIKGQYPRNLETSDQVASLIAQLEFYGLDRRDVDEYFSKIDAMSMADARRVIDKYYPLDNLVFVVIGKASEIGTVVKKYAPAVEMRSISDPGFAVGAAH